MKTTSFKTIRDFITSPWLVVIIAATVRLIYLFQYSRSPFYLVPLWDAADYHDIAIAFSQARFDPAIAYRPPLYPFLLGVIYLLFGAGALLPRLFGIVIGVWSCVLVMRIATHLYGKGAGTWAGIIAALSGLMIYFDLELLPTSLFVLFILLFLHELLKMNKGESSSFRSGLFFGLGVLTRPILLTFLPVAIFWLIKMETGIKRPTKFLVAALIPLAVSLIMHLAIGSGSVLVSAQGGVNFHIGNHRTADGITARLPGIGTGWGWEEVRRWAEAKADRSLKDSEIDRIFWREGLAEIKAYPGQWLKLMLRKALLFWNKIEISSNRDFYYHGNRFPLIGVLMLIGFTSMLPLAFVGLVLGWRRVEIKLFLSFIIVYYLTVIQFFVNGRFRHPLTPLLIILAVGGVVGLLDILKRRKGFSATRWILVGSSFLVGLILPQAMSAGFDARTFSYGLFTEGKACEELGRYDDAEMFYLKALEADSTALHINFYIAELARQRGDLPKAVDFYRCELEIQPVNAKAWNNLGTVWTELNDHRNAIACYEQALALRPQLLEAARNAARSWGMRGLKLAERDNWAEAVICFQKALAYQPDEPLFITLYLEAKFNLGDTAYVENKLPQLIEKNPNFEPALKLQRELIKP